MPVFRASIVSVIAFFRSGRWLSACSGVVKAGRSKHSAISSSASRSLMVAVGLVWRSSSALSGKATPSTSRRSKAGVAERTRSSSSTPLHTPVEESPSRSPSRRTRSRMAAETVPPTMKVKRSGSPCRAFATFSRSAAALRNVNLAWLAHWKQCVVPSGRTPQMSRPPSDPTWPCHSSDAQVSACHRWAKHIRSNSAPDRSSKWMRCTMTSGLARLLTRRPTARSAPRPARAPAPSPGPACRAGSRACAGSA